MSPIRMAKVETALRVGLEFNEAFNRRDVAGMVALLTPDCVIETASPAPDGAKYAGKEDVSRHWQEIFLESPSIQRKVEDVFGFGRQCVMRWRCNWVDAAGQQHHVRGIDILQVRDGLIFEILSYVKR